MSRQPLNLLLTRMLCRAMPQYGVLWCSSGQQPKGSRSMVHPRALLSSAALRTAAVYPQGQPQFGAPQHPAGAVRWPAAWCRCFAVRCRREQRVQSVPERCRC